MTLPVSITFTFTRDEYILALRRHYSSTLKTGRDVIAGLIAMAGGLFLVLRLSGGWAAWGLLIAGAALLLLMDLGWIQTFGSVSSSTPQLSIASEGGSGTPVPDVSIEVDDETEPNV